MRLVVWIAVGLVACMLVSCGNQADRDQLLGKWQSAGVSASQAETWIFGADGKVVMSAMGTRHEGTYTLGAFGLDLKFSDVPDPVTFKVRFDNGKLVMQKGRDASSTFFYTRGDAGLSPAVETMVETGAARPAAGGRKPVKHGK